MKVRILSGNHAGSIVEQSAHEAGNNIAMGFAEAVNDEPPAAPPKPKPLSPAADFVPEDIKPTKSPKKGK